MSAVSLINRVAAMTDQMHDVLVIGRADVDAADTQAI